MRVTNWNERSKEEWITTGATKGHKGRIHKGIKEKRKVKTRWAIGSVLGQFTTPSFPLCPSWFIDFGRIAVILGNVLQAHDANEAEKKKETENGSSEAGTDAFAAGLSGHAGAARGGRRRCRAGAA